MNAVQSPSPFWQFPMIGYLAFVLAASVYVGWQQHAAVLAETRKEKRTNMKMDELDWNTTDETVEVKARPVGLWTTTDIYVQGPARIFFQADPAQSWKYAGSTKSTPDGDFSSMIAAQNCIMTTAPVGALIGKIGGSSAGTSDAKPFLVGSYAVIEIDANTRGPLFLTINDEPSGFTNNSESIKVKIRISPQAPNSPAVSTSAGPPVPPGQSPAGPAKP